MGKYNYSETEKDINKVLKHQENELSSIINVDNDVLNLSIDSSEELLSSLGYTIKHPHNSEFSDEKIISVPTWEELCTVANAEIRGNIELEDLFTEEELKSNSLAISKLNEEFKQIYKLDKYDYAISILAGMLAGAIDILLIGIPHPGKDGVEAGPLADFIRNEFEKKFPPGALENSLITKTPYDAQDNRNTKIYVEGLSSYYHRLLELGHDPLLGFVVGVIDIMTGRMTTIDKLGHFASQKIDEYQNRVEVSILDALKKELLHLKSDVTTSMGLPVPLMSLFNFLQIGDIGQDEQTIAEIVQGMYYEGYDFIHFCSMSIPGMIADLVVRIGYAYRKIQEGSSIKEALAFSSNRKKNPKLATMLFISSSASAAINAGKVCFTKNPCAINYVQWLTFAKNSYKQLKWAILEKPELEQKYLSGKIEDELSQVYAQINHTFNDTLNEYTIIFNI